jgi:hypothetical protein
MHNELQRHGIALALLAVLVGAIVQVTQGPDPFTSGNQWSASSWSSRLVPMTKT